jgi:hypothetical protein
LTSVFQVEYKGDLAPYAYERERLRQAGIDFSSAVCADTRDLIERAKDAEIVWLEWTPHMTREVLEALARCELVIRWGVGFERSTSPLPPSWVSRWPTRRTTVCPTSSSTRLRSSPCPVAPGERVRGALCPDGEGRVPRLGAH